MCFVNVWGLIGDEQVRDERVTGSSRGDEVAEAVRKVGVGVAVWRVGGSNVLYVGAGYVEEDSIISD